MKTIFYLVFTAFLITSRPILLMAQTVNYSKSYINISKGYNGGTVDVGDTLEMRAVFVVIAGTADGVAFYDTLYSTKGLMLVPGSIALRTNEGKVYKSYTDVFDDDAGWSTTSGLDTVVQINFGNGASNFSRGQVNNNTKPRFGHRSIVLATYRVVVYAPYNTKIDFRTGAFTYKESSSASVKQVGFGSSNLMVYQSPGLCPNAVSTTNAVGAESNGTFGVPASGAPLARNRGTSAFTDYSFYSVFGYNEATGQSSGPNDLYYGIANNTSARFTTINSWNKPDANSYRLFGLWDIIGDHTGATNPEKGNAPCDTTQPVSATNPCGYMMVVNAAFEMDTVFRYTASNLCPNTYYEISAWFRNVCYKCGVDSNGLGTGNTGYIPLAPGDSSGVQPNVAFNLNGIDYYTTGNIQYFGTTPTGSDETNKWVKRGFTYLIGPSETSFTLTLRNNAPGGGGSDWAIDDISIANCMPDMKYSPTLNPTTCTANTVTIYDTVNSYFNNYTYYKWQHSTDGGTTWIDIAGESGTAVPTGVASAYQYVTSYTIPTTSTNAANDGDKYRVIVATSASNLADNNCQFFDGTNVINLTVLNNCSLLPTHILSFNGKLVNAHASLYWTTSREAEPVWYNIERSRDGIHYTRIGRIRSHSVNAERNYYTFIDSALLNGKGWYRIALVDQRNRTPYSRSIVLSGTAEALDVINVLNPFGHELLFDIAASKDVKVIVGLYTLSGTLVKTQSHTAYNGVNGFTMTGLGTLPQGMYLLQVQCGDKTVIRKVVKP